jgi:hypothetical protein
MIRRLAIGQKEISIGQIIQYILQKLAIALVPRKQFKTLRLPKAGFDLLHECGADTLP